MIHRILTGIAAAAVACAVHAQPAPAAPAAPAAEAAKPQVAPAPAPQAAPSAGGPASQNIFDIPKDTQAERQRTQPYNNAPIWREVNSGKEHYTSLPGVEKGVLIQHGGEAWRQLRNGPVTLYGGIAVLVVLSLLALVYKVRGQIKLHDKPTGRMIERFTRTERTAHWAVAFSFVALAVTGLLMLFGKHVLLPVFGYTLFGWLGWLAKNVHNFVGPFFIVATVVFFVMFVKDNIPKASDLKWLAKGGGLLTGEHVPSHRFNAGEKIWFWGGVTTLGIVVGVTGLILDFANFGQTRADMQLAWAWHVIAALVFMTMSFGHIYIGSIGMEGALDAMRTGWVDESWAKEHHEWWYDDVKAGKIPAHRSKEPAPAPLVA